MKFRKIAAATATVILLTGCANSTAGAAAVVDGTAISNSTVGDMVSEVERQIEQMPAGAIAEPPSLVDLNTMVVNRLILDLVLAKSVQRNGVSVSAADVVQFRDGVYAKYGKDVIINQLAAQNAVSLGRIDDFMRTVLLEQKLGQALVPKGTEDEQTAALVEALGAMSREMDIRVSPRFGEWNPNRLQLDAGDNLLSLLEPVTTSAG